VRKTWGGRGESFDGTMRITRRGIVRSAGVGDTNVACR